VKLFLLVVILFFAENSFCQQFIKAKIKVITLEFDEENELSDTSFFYIESKSELTFELLNEHLYGTGIRITDSFRNKSRSADTIVIKSNVENTSYETTIAKIYDNEGYLIEYYYSSCIDCGNQPYRIYYMYDNNKIHTVINDNLGSSTRQIYEVNYDHDKAVNEIIIYKEYNPKNLNLFSNLFNKPNFKEDIDYTMRKVEAKVLIKYD
jgi:hypothetical protein